MADTTFLANGFSIIGDPQVSGSGAPLNSNTNASGGGELMIHSGSAVFEADDIVMYEVSGANDDGSFNSNTVITGIIVYDNASDYYNDVALYTYTASPGASIPSNRNGMGDSYLRFDASDLLSTDPGAPVLGDMIFTAGVDVLSALDSTSGPLEVDTSQDIDLNGDGVISGDEVGDGTFSSAISGLAVICFAKGTLIETPEGPKFIESLRAGDLVNTLDQGAQPIRWIGSRRVDGTGENAPITFKAGALGNIRDLRVSPNHRMLMTGVSPALITGEHEVLVAAKHLLNGDTITQAPTETIDYFHFLFDAHQIVFAEGCPTESLYPGKRSLGTVSDQSRAEIISLFPELEKEDPAPLTRYEMNRLEACALVG